jgi:hypothetical protein
MHAQVITVELTDRDAAVHGVGHIIPFVKAMPGFVAGYWVIVDDKNAISLTVYETEEQARATAPPLGAGEEGVTVTGVQIGEVIGSA